MAGKGLVLHAVERDVQLAAQKSFVQADATAA